MLVLSRKALESVVINDDVEIVVIAIQGERVRLGFEAPRGVSIHRKEVWLRLHGAPSSAAEALDLSAPPPAVDPQAPLKDAG